MKLAKNTMSFSSFCKHIGTPLRSVYSWCAINPEKRRAVFTVWEDKLLFNGRNYRYVFWKKVGVPDDRPRAKERLKVIVDAMQNGYEMLGVRCKAKDVAIKPRSRKRFEEDTLLVLRFVDEPEELVAYVQREVTTSEVLKGVNYADLTDAKHNR